MKPELQLAPEPSGSPLKAIVIASVVLVLVAVAVYFLNPRKTADLAVTKAEVFAPAVKMKNTESKGMHVVGTVPSTEKSTYVVATLKLDDKLRLPLYFVGVEATADLASGEHLQATVLSSEADLTNVRLAFPELVALMPHALTDGDAAQPGGSLEGQVLLLFPNMTPEQWKQKHAAGLTLTLAHQDPLHVAIP